MSIDYSSLTFPKGTPRRTVKARKDRAEDQAAKVVRSDCLERDGYCRASGLPGVPNLDQGRQPGWDCDGPAEWAHMHIRRRSKTRGQAPEVRHDTKHSLMLCRYHHQEYDAHRLIITALTRRGADGPLKFRRAK